MIKLPKDSNLIIIVFLLIDSFTGTMQNVVDITVLILTILVNFKQVGENEFINSIY